ncbi:MAG: hypothetical protein ACXV5H_11135, partial [Halobacteriota archaeon]
LIAYFGEFYVESMALNIAATVGSNIYVLSAQGTAGVTITINPQSGKKLLQPRERGNRLRHMHQEVREVSEVLSSNSDIKKAGDLFSQTVRAVVT